MSVCPSVSMEQFGSHLTDFHENWYLSIFRKSVQKIQVSLKCDRITGTLHEDQYGVLVKSLAVLRRMKDVSDKYCRENHNTHCMFNYFFFFNRTMNEIMWKIILEPGRPQMTIWRMRIGCWIPKATNIHSEYVVFIAFTLQQWLHGRVSMLRKEYIACLVALYRV
jgi:hypothetical protein